MHSNKIILILASLLVFFAFSCKKSSEDISIGGKYCEDWDTKDSNGYRFSNNVWGKGSYQNGVDYTACITVTDAFPSETKIEWNWPLNNGGVRSYQEIYVGRKPWDSKGTENSPFPIKINNLKEFKVEFDLDRSYSSNGYNIALETWLANDPDGGQSAITHEVMIWLHKGSDPSPAGGNGNSANLVLSGPSHQVWRNANHNSWDYTAVVYDSDYLAGTVDMKLVLKEWKRLGWVSGEEYILDLELGAEVVLGEGSFTIKNFIVTAN